MDDQIAILAGLAEATQAALDRIETAPTLAELDVVRREAIGKTGKVLAVRRMIGNLAADHKRVVGAAVNEAQQQVVHALERREQELLGSEPVLAHPFDVTLPGLWLGDGTLHPTVQMMYDLNDAFAALNFEVYEGPEISSEQFEFDYMNFPPDHPARESMDTFWLEGMTGKQGAQRLCLRPHLTGASVRFMRERTPPFRFVYPGRVYRNESTDARHERAFFQYEVLMVDERVPLTAGKFLVDTILSTVFGRDVPTRMRTGFFPFVEPGFEIDMVCQVCSGDGCRTCRYVGWLEVMPGGSPHPNVLRAGGIDPDRWTGFYVNVGLDRLVMMRYGIDDVRMMHSADLRYLRQFA
ncbi:phenylalanine--tRNA ligase alpha subunit [Rhizocola hellebori]|uniref:Phenylalanine--tRNA ligase alpha subunit n=1 Tax=Rhizocola hellebori TaxID=1392758 RepID=A0A8J3VJI8_9ACTN|nr:phenylalanine--tRNA ligase subunit alpha [Rhizocola hellebori]GIH08502.1 phenylalanine--tRNA ligase alpha subunit [Rhizocola hellebori]